MKLTKSTLGVWILAGLLLSSIIIFTLVQLKTAAPQTPEEILSSVKDRVARDLPAIASNDTYLVGQMASGIPIYDPNYQFGISSRTMRSISFLVNDSELYYDPSSNTSIIMPISVFDIAQGVILDAGYNTENIKNGSVTYKKDTSTCVFTDFDSITTLSCYTKQDITNAFNSMKPFHDAIVASQNGKVGSETLVFNGFSIKSEDGSGVISASKSEGYDIAETSVSVGDRVMLDLFYRKGSDPWRYVTQAGDEYGFPCDDMKKDPDARKALYDQVCLSDSGQVRLDTDNRALQ